MPTGSRDGASDPWGDVVGQPEAVAQLRAAAAAPVHAYLLVGPHGSGKRQLALAFAADLLSEGLDDAGAERARDLVQRERHPDLTIVEREGAYIRKPEADLIIHEASRSSTEHGRKVLVLEEFHLVQEAGPQLLKTIEEPPPGVVFVVLAEELPPELVTIASRCVRIDVGPVPTEVIRTSLVADGVGEDAAGQAAEAARGDLRRARVLAADPAVAIRHRFWHDVPTHLDRTGSRALRLADELLSLIDQAAEPLQLRQGGELAELEARVEQYGERGAGRRDLEARHKRELRRHRVDELRYGLGVLASRYRDALVAEPTPTAAQAVDRIQQMAEGLIRNPNERVQLLALFLDLEPLPAAA